MSSWLEALGCHPVQRRHPDSLSFEERASEGPPEKRARVFLRSFPEKVGGQIRWGDIKGTCITFMTAHQSKSDTVIFNPPI